MSRSQIWDGSQWVNMTNSPLASGTDADAIHDNQASEIAAITEKGTPTTSDFLLIEDAAASNVKKRVTIGNLPSAAADHGALTGLGDSADHTWASLVDGSRAFTGTVAGVTPTADADLATKLYVDQSMPPGVIVPYGGAAAPTGWLLADGAEVNRTTYADLFAIFGTTFGIGNGSTTFDLPDMRQRFPLGKAVSGTGAGLGDTGGSIDPTIDVSHSHTVDGHTHTINHGHADTLSTASDGGHVHTMGTHTHTTSIDHNHGAATSAAGSSHGHTMGTHSHVIADTSNGPSSTYSVIDGIGVTVGSGTHTHYVSDTSTSVDPGDTNSEAAHTHSVDLPNYNVGNVTSSATDPGDTSSTGSHTHTVNGSVTDHTGSSGSTGPGTDSQLSATESVPNAPFLALNYIIKT